MKFSTTLGVQALNHTRWWATNEPTKGRDAQRLKEEDQVFDCGTPEFRSDTNSRCKYLASVELLENRDSNT